MDPIDRDPYRISDRPPSDPVLNRLTGETVPVQGTYPPGTAPLSDPYPTYGAEHDPRPLRADGSIDDGSVPSPVEVKSVFRCWSIKDGQEVIDKNTGLTLRFGSYGDGSGSVYLQATLTGKRGGGGTTVVFQRDGEVTRLLPHVAGTEDEQRARADEEAKVVAENARPLEHATVGSVPFRDMSQPVAGPVGAPVVYPGVDEPLVAPTHYEPAPGRAPAFAGLPADDR